MHWAAFTVKGDTIAPVGQAYRMDSLDMTKMTEVFTKIEAAKLARVETTTPIKQAV